MGYKSDIEIAQECQMLPITEIAAKAGISDEYLEQYGKYKAKIDYKLLKDSDRKDGKLILVTAMNPISASRAALQAADTLRSFPWRTSTFTSQVISTRSVPRTTCWQQ